MPFSEEKVLGKVLLEENLISQSDLNRALQEQKKTGRRLGKILAQLGLLSEEQILPFISKQWNIPYLQIALEKIEPRAVESVSAKVAHHYKLMPIALKDGALTVALTDPNDIYKLDEIRLVLKSAGYTVRAVLASEKDVERALKQFYGVGAETLEKMTERKRLSTAPQKSTAVAASEELESSTEDATVIRFVNQILLDAVNSRATDIHIEPFEDRTRLRHRIDGMLYEVQMSASIKEFHAAIVSRIKVMAGLDIAERRIPQDGRIKVKVGGLHLDLRVSILPTPFGESVDIRLLSGRLYGLEQLGLEESDLKILNGLLKKPHGIIFLTGPTGSGKSTTLYAFLKEIRQTSRKIITIEDPVEYLMDGITQVQVQPKIGLTFASGLRSMLRHDPDVMMVGEVRDYETAEITIRVALTGHLVFSTLHTNDAAGSVARLLDMGIEPYLIASSVECFMAQRLVRTLCPSCKRPAPTNPALLESLKIPGALPAQTFAGDGYGCAACHFTGYAGRTAIYEILVPNEELRSKILARRPSTEMNDCAVKAGMRTLASSALQKVARGETTLEEVVRVTQTSE